MTTNQPNDQRGHANGVTERIAPSPIPPRPIPRPGASEGGAPQAQSQSHEMPDNSGDFAPEVTGRMSDPTEVTAPESVDEPQQQPAGSPYQDGGWSQLPQREPQSNLYRPGQAPVQGRPSGGLSGGLNAGVSNARTTADLAAKAARKEAAMVKSVGIDGPTRSIARPELVKDLPDLSEMRHPLPPPEPIAPAGPVSPSAPAAVAQAAATGEPLRATVQLRHIDPWSTLKVSLVISVAMFFVWMLAVGLLYLVLEGMGVWERLNSTFTDMVSDSSSTALIDAGTVFGYAGVIGLINVVLLTALSTVGVFVYNQCTDLVGGIQVTLADPD
ncbi:DUF3566 domain-containing protein [Nocardia sp. NPDC127526]|uniref:DUF3566 domain-containing protein n=1 Tax=Nocardia sp. NPDC127526 TaxID=3345393 RepID=UPI00363DDEBF